MSFCLFGGFATDVFAESGEYGEIIYEYNDGNLELSCKSGNNCAVGPNTYGYGKYKNETKSVIINDGIDTIRDEAFMEWKNLEEIKFPKSMGNSIGKRAFYGCEELKSIKLPIGITRVGEYAFYGTQISKVELPIYLDWLEDHAFNDNTEIIKLKEKEGIIAAGTAGRVRGGYDNPGGEGRASNGTCYNKFYFGQYYDDTAYWRVENDGTLVVWGTDLHYGYSNSRVPWGCFEDYIKKAVFNDDKTGTLTKRNKVGSKEPLSNTMYAIYASKPYDSIMDQRIKVISGYQFGDSRHKETFGMVNLKDIYVNRGVEVLGNNALSTMGIHNSEINYYITKTVKKIGYGQADTGYNSWGDTLIPRRFHFEISNEDYLSNNYNYGSDLADSNGIKSIVNEGRSKQAIIDTGDSPYYVSINDTSAPATIAYKGKTLYKYETYITEDNGSVDVSLPNMDDVDYYVKEIKAPEGFQIDPEVYEVDMSGKTIDIQVSDYPIGYVDPSSRPKQLDNEKNPNTATTTPAVYFMLFGAISSILALIGCGIRRLSK